MAPGLKVNNRATRLGGGGSKDRVRLLKKKVRQGGETHDRESPSRNKRIVTRWKGRSSRSERPARATTSRFGRERGRAVSWWTLTTVGTLEDQRSLTINTTKDREPLERSKTRGVWGEKAGEGGRKRKKTGKAVT